MSDVFTAEGLNIEYAGDPTFVYGSEATASAQPFIGIVGHHTSPPSVNSLVNYGKTIDQERGGAFGYHFYVGRDGRIVQGAPLTKRTNHVKPPGSSQRSGRPGNNLANNNSIGVSMVGGTPGNATDIQIDTTFKLMQALMSHFGISNTSVFGHGEVQSDRQAEEGMAAVRRVRGDSTLPGITTGVQDGPIRNQNLPSSDSGSSSDVFSGQTQTAQTLTINSRDKAILDLIASKESNGQYDLVYPNTENPSIMQMSLQEILEYQNKIGGSAMAIQYSRTTAIGRYQLIQDQVVQGISLTNIDRFFVRFAPDVQDAMALQIIKQVCKYDDWLQGSLSTDQFQFNLSGQFESVPLPCAQQEGEEDGRRAGRVGSQLAQHDCDTFADQLNDIRSMSRGRDITLTIDPGSVAGVSPAGGASERRQVETALGNGIHTGGHQGITPGSGLSLPDASTPYAYQPIDPYDDRYDFRTGKKVRDILINGIAPVSSSSLPPITQGANSTPGVQGGTQGATDPQGTTTSSSQTALVNGQIVEVGFGEGQVDPALARAAGGSSIGYGTGQVDPSLAGQVGYTSADAQSVESLRSFNQQIGGGTSRAQLTPGERAYAQQQGYLSTPTGSAGFKSLPQRPSGSNSGPF